MTDTSNLPLDGIRVLDFTQAEQGPIGTLQLADFGADVIKIERPGVGDLSRHTVGGTSLEATNNPTYVAMNRNKRSMEIDTKSEAGKQIIYDLVKEMDVVVNNFRPGVMDKLGFSYEKLKEINPRIIFAAATGYGPVGPYAERPGQDMVAQAVTGCNGLNRGPVNSIIDLSNSPLRLYRRNASLSGHYGRVDWAGQNRLWSKSGSVAL